MAKNKKVINVKMDASTLKELNNYNLKDVTQMIKTYKKLFPIGRSSSLDNSNAKEKIWMTMKGECIPYSLLRDSHLDNIIAMLENDETKILGMHYKGLIQERLRRKSKAGQILYG